MKLLLKINIAITQEIETSLLHTETVLQKTAVSVILLKIKTAIAP
jgi:hypothetical protein